MNSKNKKYLATVVFVSLIVLVLFNPSENRFLNTVSKEYSSFHQEHQISADILKNMGRTKRTTYLLFSTFNYKFGNKSLYYLGIANTVFYVGSRLEEQEKPFIRAV